MKLRTVASLALTLALVAAGPAQAAKTPDTGKDATSDSFGLLGEALATALKHHLNPVDAPKAVEAAMTGMMKSLDPNSDYYSPAALAEMRSRAGRPASVGLHLRVDLIGVRVHRKIIRRDEIQVGDYLLAVDGRATRGDLGDTNDRLRGVDGSPVALTLLRDGRIVEVIVARRIAAPRTGLTSRMIGDVGYVAIHTFHENATADLEAAIQGLRAANPRIKALVFDLRDSTGGLFEECVGLADLFLDDGLIAIQRGREPNDVDRYAARRGDVLQGLPMAVLVNDVTSSGAEIVAGALQDRGRARLVGMPTWGAGTIQVVIPLRAGQAGAIRLTTSEVRLPSGRSFDKTGLAPDLLVASEAEAPRPGSGEAADPAAAQRRPEMPPKGFDPNGDYQLMRALELLKG